jgi:hypothetical protein
MLQKKHKLISVIKSRIVNEKKWSETPGREPPRLGMLFDNVFVKRHRSGQPIEIEIGTGL